MKSKLVKIVFAFIFILAIIGIEKSVQANSISKISMDIYIDKNGDAQVTEVWNCSVNQGTESYHPYYNLGNSKITNLTVSEGTKTYTTLSSWDTSGSLNTKAYKCGINKISNGVELCWGISTYGAHNYTVKYTISKFISQLTDSQMVYWTLIPYDFSTAIGDVKIKIYSDTYIKDTVDVWGYGNYGGLCYVSNGAIYMDSDGRLGTSEYMTILVKFPQETFETTNDLNHDFNYYYEMAEKGSTKYNKKTTSAFTIVKGIIILVFQTFQFWLFIIAAIIASKKGTSKKYGFKPGPEGRKIPKDVPYYRDIPCNGDILRSYYISYQYGLVKKKTDILGAIILKWLKQGIIRTENREGGKVFKREDTVIILEDGKNTTFSDRREKEIFDMMYEASEDGVLENKEFEKWCKKSYTKILGWFDDILRQQRDKLVEEGLINTEERGFWFGKKYTSTSELKEEAMKIAGLKKYLLEYTLIKDREAIEVELFESYLIYAQMLGIADKVSKQFKELYPDLIEQTHYNSYDNIVYINMCTTRGISSANSARAAAQSYSSGGGGFSSGGGGGGSFGGGGGRRRFPLKFNK